MENIKGDEIVGFFMPDGREPTHEEIQNFVNRYWDALNKEHPYDFASYLVDHKDEILKHAD